VFVLHADKKPWRQGRVAFCCFFFFCCG
jgi:hypothetical protein